MKKYTFVVYYKEYAAFLEKLCDIGVLHPIRIEGGDVDSEEMQSEMTDFDRINRLISELKVYVPENEMPNVKATASEIPIGQFMDNLDKIFSQKEKLEKEIEVIGKEMASLEIWGEFDPEQLKRLEAAGWHIRFYAAHDRIYDPEWEKFNAIKIASQTSVNYFITITKDEMPDIDADSIVLPDSSYSELKRKYDELNLRLDNLKKEVAGEAIHALSVLQYELLHVKDRIAILMTRQQTHVQADEKLMLLEGWVPVSKVAQIDAELEKQGVFFQVADPQEDEKVPIALKNNRFARLFEFITDLYDMPKYGTMDMTPFFAPFFVIFFGLCFGDFGYGALIVLAMLLIKKKGAPSLKKIVPFGIYMGISCMFFGLLTGNCFGIELMKVDWPFIKPLQHFMITTDDVFILALALGIVQILFGRILNAISLWTRFGFRYAFPTIGWILVIAGCIIPLIAVNYKLIEAETANPIVFVSGIVAAIGILLFSDPKRKGIKILLNIPGGLYNVYENVTGLLGDVLSYIRLFALSLSGAVMAIVFNQLAMDMSGDIPFVRELIMLVVLLIGHGMNIFMSGLGSFIHPMRLTFVEFYKNAGFEGGGKKYQPLERSK
ncbi:MAG: V-type ATPase 116kDa subunit family protein [Bacteroidales bacterium]|nr:V-type ATPase 116kDa subunit family protein [Bacteroidales bacterium]